MKKHTNIVTLPKALPKRSYITRSGGSWHPGDIALCFALVIRFEDSADALRKLARRLVDKVCLEHQPNMKRLSREPDDQKVWNAVLKIIDRSFEIWMPQPDCTPEQRLAWQEARVSGPFLRNTWKDKPVEVIEPPRCHMKPMRLAGYHKHRHWKCQHCTHTKPIVEVNNGESSDL